MKVASGEVYPRAAEMETENAWAYSEDGVLGRSDQASPGARVVIAPFRSSGPAAVPQTVPGRGFDPKRPRTSPTLSPLPPPRELIIAITAFARRKSPMALARSSRTYSRSWPACPRSTRDGGMVAALKLRVLDLCPRDHHQTRGRGAAKPAPAVRWIGKKAEERTRSARPKSNAAASSRGTIRRDRKIGDDDDRSLDDYDARLNPREADSHLLVTKNRGRHAAKAEGTKSKWRPSPPHAAAERSPPSSGFFGARGKGKCASVGPDLSLTAGKSTASRRIRGLVGKPVTHRRGNGSARLHDDEIEPKDLPPVPYQGPHPSVAKALSIASEVQSSHFAFRYREWPRTAEAGSIGLLKDTLRRTPRPEERAGASCTRSHLRAGAASSTGLPAELRNFGTRPMGEGGDRSRSSAATLLATSGLRR